MNRRGSSGRRLARGVTAVESLVVVSILGIVAATTAPSFRSFLDAQQVKGYAFDLTTDLLMARSEALKRNASVVLTPSASGWESGWTVTAAGAAEPLRRRDNASPSVLVSGAPTSIAFDVNGRVSAPLDDVRIDLNGVESAAARCIEVDLSGRARSSVGGCT